MTGDELRAKIAAGEIAVWCPCYTTEEPTGTWVAPDDFHADTHVIDWMKAKERLAPVAADPVQVAVMWQATCDTCGWHTPPSTPESAVREWARVHRLSCSDPVLLGEQQ